MQPERRFIFRPGSFSLVFLVTVAVRRATAADNCPPGCQEVKCTCSEEPGRVFVTCEEIELNFTGCLDDTVSEFYLRRSSLTSIGPEEFKNAINLTQIEITDNSLLVTIEEGTFSGLPKLLQLFLSNNAISSLPDDLFNGTENLNTLSVDYNKLDFFMCPRLPHLESLDLSGNQIIFFWDFNFENCSNLRYLNASKNAIVAFHLVTNQLPYLLDLDLSYNEIIDPEISPETNLNRLNLAFNPITKLQPLPIGLNVLDLRGSWISTIGANYFENLTQLTWLDLSEMLSLTTIKDNAFAKLPSLFGINLRNNRMLSNLPSNVWPDSFGLTVIELRDCNISVFHPELFEDLSELAIADIAGNPVHCDCGATWMRNFMDESRYAIWINEWKTGPGTVVCQSPENMRGIPVSQLNYYDLTCDHSRIASHSTFSTSDTTIFEVELINGLPKTSWYLPNGLHIHAERHNSTAVNKRDDDEDIVVEELLSQNMVIVARLTIKPLSDEDYGLYVLEWTNIAGSDNFTFTLEHDDPAKKRLSSSGVAAIVVCLAMVVIFSVVGFFVYRYAVSRRRPYGGFEFNDDGSG